MPADAIELEALIAAVLEAPDDATRAAAGATLLAVPDALTQIARMITSTDGRERRLGLHFVSRLSPPPALFSWSIAHCLRSPLDPDPLGEELALTLVCMASLASELFGYRYALADRIRDVDTAEGPRAPVMRRLAHDTLAALDAARADHERKWSYEIAAIIAQLQTGRHADAELHVTQSAAGSMYPELSRAARWEAAGDKLRATDPTLTRFCYERALLGFEEHASYATAGGEGYERTLDVHRMRAILRAL